MAYGPSGQVEIFDSAKPATVDCTVSKRMDPSISSASLARQGRPQSTRRLRRAVGIEAGMYGDGDRFFNPYLLITKHTIGVGNDMAPI
jgi:hypothetical protein